MKLNPARIDPVHSLYKIHTRLDVLRLDLLHPVVSGNKWFKLKNYLSEAAKLNKKYILTFGGAWSNHIVATAAATKAKGLSSIGIIRGERPAVVSETISTALEYGMKIFYTSREDFAQKTIPPGVFEKFSEDEIYQVPEGGFGLHGMRGAMDILDETDHQQYDHIVAATGTGTMLAGLANKVQPGQKLTGISVLKNNFSVEDDIRSLLPPSKHQAFRILYDFHWGGYAKKNIELIDFMNEWYRKTAIPSDFVYTGKLFFALNSLVKNGYFDKTENILVIHSGGLQGNNSLDKGTLIF